ncbi:hypothetical protein VTP01DRAFT_7109 [Rhizomucor pusillus]|uniref:uncharacterized protein n=1 Tax=Rhizomucor pusillus TaxID=4840 RepID=UPI00374215C7
MKNQGRKGGSGKEQEKMARPALEHHACEARSDLLDLSRLQKETAESSRKLAFGGTDCGIVKTSVTVPISLQQYRHHIELYKWFQPLSTKEEDDDDDSNGNDELTSQRCNDLLILPKPSTISSKHMCNKAMVYKNAKYREKGKARNPEVREAEENIANNNVHNAKSVEDVSNWQKIFRKHRDTLPYFYNSPAENQAKWSQELALKKAYSQEASRERAYVKEACGTGRKSIPIMFIGDQGLGTNARINGHVKGVATKIRKEHHLHTVVVMTSEYRTSQTCGWCLGPVVRPRATILKDGKEKKRSFQGAFLCMNSKCPLYSAGRAVQSRDYMAAICIALNGISRVIDGIHLSPFTRHSAALHMLNTSNSPDIVGNAAQEDSVEGTDIQSSLDECKTVEGYLYAKANDLSILVLYAAWGVLLRWLCLHARTIIASAQNVAN